MIKLNNDCYMILFYKQIVPLSNKVSCAAEDQAKNQIMYQIFDQFGGMRSQIKGNTKR
jgi:hypothetical protein